MGSATLLWLPYLGNNHAARVVLLTMSNISLDPPKDGAASSRREARTYFGGWRPLASALGLSGSETRQREYISRHIKVLIDAGALTIVTKPAPGRNARYRLNLDLKTLDAEAQAS